MAVGQVKRPALSISSLMATPLTGALPVGEEATFGRAAPATLRILNQLSTSLPRGVSVECAVAKRRRWSRHPAVVAFRPEDEL